MCTHTHTHGGCDVTVIMLYLRHARQTYSHRPAAGFHTFFSSLPSIIMRHARTNSSCSPVCVCRFCECVSPVGQDCVPLCVFTVHGKYWDFHFTSLQPSSRGARCASACVSTCPALFMRQLLRATRLGKNACTLRSEEFVKRRSECRRRRGLWGGARAILFKVFKS